MVTVLSTVLVTLVTLVSVSTVGVLLVVASIIDQVKHHGLASMGVNVTDEMLRSAVMATVTSPVSATIVGVRPVSRPSLGTVNPLLRGCAVKRLHGGGVAGAMVSVLTWSGATVHLVSSNTHEVVGIIEQHVGITLHVLHTPGVHTLVILGTGLRVWQTNARNITGTAIGEFRHTLTYESNLYLFLWIFNILNTSVGRISRSHGISLH